MFCGNCGSQNPDGATVCAVCGASLTPEEPARNPDESPSKGNKNKIIGCAIIAAVVVAAVILLIVIFSGRSDKAVLKQYVKASFDRDAKDFVDVMPDSVFKLYADTEGISKKEARREIVEFFEDDMYDYEDYYDDIDFDEIRGVDVEIRRENGYTSREIREINDGLKDENINMTVKDAKSVKIRVTGKDDGDKFSFTVDNIEMFKVGRSWYIADPDPDDILSELERKLR